MWSSETGLTGISETPDCGIQRASAVGGCQEVLDEVANPKPNEDPHVGSIALKERVHEVVPNLHVFGHIHEAYGELSRYIQSMSDDHYNDSIKFVNASICNLDYNAVNDPVVVEV